MMKLAAASLFATLALLLPALAEKPKVIDLSRPLSESLEPDRLYWNFDHGPANPIFAGSVLDASPNRFHGRLHSGDLHPEPTYTEGRFGKGLHIEGETPPREMPDGTRRTQRNPRVTWRASDTMEAWAPELLDLAQTSFTMGLWIRFERVREEGVQTVVLLCRGMPPDPSRWTFNLSKGNNADWRITFNGSRSPEATTAFNDGQWHHVAVTIDAQNATALFYLDGTPLGSPVPFEPIPPLTNERSGRQMILGESTVGNFSTGFVGAVDELFITSGPVEFKP